MYLNMLFLFSRTQEAREELEKAEEKYSKDDNTVVAIINMKY